MRIFKEACYAAPLFQGTLRQPATPASKAAPSLQVVEQKLRDLKALLDQGLITQSDYDTKKAQILQNF